MTTYTPLTTLNNLYDEMITYKVQDTALIVPKCRHCVSERVSLCFWEVSELVHCHVYSLHTLYLPPVDSLWLGLNRGLRLDLARELGLEDVEGDDDDNEHGYSECQVRQLHQSLVVAVYDAILGQPGEGEGIGELCDGHLNQRLGRRWLGYWPRRWTVSHLQCISLSSMRRRRLEPVLLFMESFLVVHSDV